MKRILMVLLLAPSAALAQMDSTDIRYSWLQLSHVKTMADTDALDASGWNFNVSFAVRDHIHLFADYESAELDDFSDVTGKEKTFGIGTHFDVLERLSLFGRAGFYDVSADDGTTSADDDGLRVIAGARFMPLPGYEVRGGVDYVDLDDAGDDTRAFVAGDIFLADGFALTGEVLFHEDGEAYTLGVRFYFGQ